jgi:hypothetical protein
MSHLPTPEVRVRVVVRATGARAHVAGVLGVFARLFPVEEFSLIAN